MGGFKPRQQHAESGTQPRGALHRTRSRVEPARNGHAERGSISVDEAHRRYDGKWVIMKVTAVDEHGLPLHGEIVGHSASHAAIWRQFSKLVPETEPAGDLYYLFSAAPRIRTGEDLRRALDEADERGEVSGWHRW